MAFEGRTAVDIVLRLRVEMTLNNETLLLDEGYINWMTSKPPDRSLEIASITKDQEVTGVFIVSSSSAFCSSRVTDKMAVIGNLMLSKSMQTRAELLSAFHGAKMIARNTLECTIVSMLADERNETLRNACKKAGFMETGNSASMFHQLNQAKRLDGISKGV